MMYISDTLNLTWPGSSDRNQWSNSSFIFSKQL